MGLISRVSSRTYRKSQVKSREVHIMPPKIQKSKEAKAKAAMSSGKGKKKKWSKGKVRDKLVNLALFDKATWDKFAKEVPAYKLITPSIVSERLKVRASLAKSGLRKLAAEGKIRPVVTHAGQMIYSRIGGDDEKEAPADKK